MLTVFVDDLLKRPRLEIEKMVSFIGGTFTVNSNHGGLTISQIVKKLQDSIMSRDIPLEHIPMALIQKGVAAIEDELSNSKELTSWPCKLFSKLNTNLPLLPKLLSPNCSAPYVKCTIKYDIEGAR
jgi:hypothetical protein